MKITLTVNGKAVAIDADDAQMPLLYALRDDLGLHGPRFGCGLGQCGACTVHVDGRAIRSCVMPVGAVTGKKIVTLEGLGAGGKPHPLQKAFIDEQAVQCGFCLSGVVLTAKAYLDRNPKASDAEIRRALSGVLCRCGANTRMLKAIVKYARGIRA